MASLDVKTNSTYATTNWDEYQKGRLQYPSSLTDIIYDYRRQHPQARWDRLVDIGAGSGVASIKFMPDFKIVHNSDPSPWNEEQARTFLPDWANRLGLNTIFEYSQSTGEETYAKTGEKQVDLAICATAAHFMDPDGLVLSIAKMLRPGGTLAVFSYWMPIFPDCSQHFHEVFAKTFDNTVLKFLQAGDETNQARLAKVVQRRMAGKGVLDSLPIPEELYVDPLRVYINAGTGEVPYSALFRRFTSPSSSPGGITRVSPGDRICNYHTGIDPAAEGWSLIADKQYLSNFFDTIRPANARLSEEESRDVHAEWQQAFDDECPAGTVRVLWPAYIVLATRK